MSKKKQAQLRVMLLILAGLAVLFAAGILLNRWAAQRKERQEEAAIPRIPTLDNVTGLTLTNGAESLSFTQKEDGTWYWTEDEDFPLDESYCTAITDLTDDFTAEQQFDIVDDLSAYGLEEPEQRLTLTNEDGESVTLLVGIQTGDLYYAMSEGGDQIYTIDSTLSKALSHSLYDMAQLADYPILSSDIMREVTIAGKNTETFTIKAVEVEVSDDEEGDSSESSSEPETETEYHWFLSNDTDVTDKSLVTSLRTELDQIALDSLAYYKPTEQVQKSCGLNDPTAVITVHYTEDEKEQTSVLTLGSYVDDSDSYYCTLDTNPDEIYLIKSDSVASSVEIAQQGFEQASEEADEK